MFVHLLRTYPIVRVVVDADHPDVYLPSRFTGRVGLDYGLNMAVPIPDMMPDEHGVTATLSFSGRPFPTDVPWDAVVAICDADSGLGVSWDASWGTDAKLESAPQGVSPGRATKVPFLRVIEGGAA